MSLLKGQTALITGASSGIGQAIANKLAANGINLVLAARSTAKLNEIAVELSEHYNIKTTVLTTDLSLPGFE